MAAMFIIALVVLGFMTVVNLIFAAIADDDMVPFLVLNILVMTFGIVTIGVALGS